ncbi:uncharacterized protein LOC132713208, partial [Ruditapes philippinarum]|uniref:uncharacterized protein LOC132713208 n=1 Tax=Ruditapes philippinarum TaxID=129788 RepID=UPI00295ADCBD
MERESKLKNGLNGKTFSSNDKVEQMSVSADSTMLNKDKDEDALHDVTEDVEGCESWAPEDKTWAPVDKGWAWVILAACVFEIIIYGGLLRSLGVFFLQYQTRFNYNA